MANYGFMPYEPPSLYGMKVVISPDQPKMKLAPGDYVSQDFREEIDHWLLDFFGVTNIIPDGQVITLHSLNQLVMNQRTYRYFKAAQKENT